MRIETIRDLGLVVRDRRRSLGLSQQQVADRIGTARQWVAALESGRAQPGLAPVLRALAVLDLAIDVSPTDSSSLGSGTATDRLTPIDLDRLLDDLREAR